MIKNRRIWFSFFSLLVLITFIYGKLQGGYVSWFLFYALLSLFAYEWAIVKFSLKDLKVNRKFLRTHITAGEDIVVEIEIFNKMSFPHSYILVEDTIPIKLVSKAKQPNLIVYPWFRSKSILRYTIPKAYRGIHRWNKITLITGDIFGLTSIKKTIHLYGEVMVYPKSYPIEAWDSRNPYNTGMSFSQNRISQETNSVVGIREYQMGDRFNRIHWKQSARAMQLMTKEFERQITNDFMFFLDRDQETYERLKPDYLEVGIELIASLSKFAIEKHFHVGLVSAGRTREAISIARGHEQIKRIYDLLALVEADGEFPFTKTVLQEIPFLSPGVTLVLVTPRLNDEVYQLLAELAIRKKRVELYYINLEGLRLDEELGNKIKSLEGMGIRLKTITGHDWFKDFQGGYLNEKVT